jgi:hypothetical protein
MVIRVLRHSSIVNLWWLAAVWLIHGSGITINLKPRDYWIVYSGVYMQAAT